MKRNGKIITRSAGRIGIRTLFYTVMASVAGIMLAVGPAFAVSSEVFNFSDEVAKGDQKAGFTLKQMVKTPEYTAGAISVKDEIKMHLHKDGNHVIYIVSGSGAAILDGKPVTLKPGMILHIPKGSTHNIKAEGGDLTILDFAHPPFDPAKMEWIK